MRNDWIVTGKRARREQLGGVRASGECRGVEWGGALGLRQPAAAFPRQPCCRQGLTVDEMLTDWSLGESRWVRSPLSDARRPAGWPPESGSRLPQSKWLPVFDRFLANFPEVIREWRSDYFSFV